MGAWGITAFESDAGLDVVGAIRKSLPEDGRLTLQTILESVKSSQWRELADPQLGNSHTSPLAVTELIFKLQDGQYSDLDYGMEYGFDDKLFKDLLTFTADKESLQWLKDYLTENLTAARNNAALPFNPNNGWFHREDWEGWQTHMESVIERLGELLDRPEDEIDLLENGQTQDEQAVLSM